MQDVLCQKLGKLMCRLREIFATNIKLIRSRLGLSQEGLAAKCNLHRTYISSVERAKRNVSIDNIERIALALNVPPSQLLECDHYDRE